LTQTIEIQRLVYCPKAQEDVTLEWCVACDFHESDMSDEIECGYEEE